MGISSEYREFDSLESYREFFRECQDAGTNKISMMLPRASGGPVLRSVLVTSPDHDHNLAKALVDRFAKEGVKWKIAPVLLTPERRRNTDKKNYRVRLRKHLVADYRRDMKNKEDPAFFPLLVQVEDEDFWASGRHRSEGAEGYTDAVYALVVETLTPSQLLFISDTTNRWHSEKWDGDEFANLAYDYHMIDGMPIGKALLHAGLDPTDKDLFQSVLLWRRYSDINLKEEGAGHPLYFPALLKLILPYLGHFQSGVDLTGGLTKAEWMNIVWDKTGTSKKVANAYTGGERLLQSDPGKWDGRKTWMLEGATLKQKYAYFLKLKKRMESESAATNGGVKEITDEQKWIAFIKVFRHLGNEAFVNIQHNISEEWQEESRKLVYRLGLVFGD